MNKENYDATVVLPMLAAMMQSKINSLSPGEKTRNLKDIEDEKEYSRVKWFIAQGTCPYCGTKLRRGKKDKNHVRKWWCIKCNIYLSKE